MFTICIPVRNGARSIENAVASAVAQSGAENFEVLVCDNHSTDDTAAKLNELHRVAAQSAVSKDAVRLVHAFKSSAAMAGADALSAAAAALEHELSSTPMPLKTADAELLQTLFEAYRTAIIERGMAASHSLYSSV